MKRVLCIAAVMIVCVTGVCRAARSTNPSRTVLYTCGAADELYFCEFYSNMKVAGNKFACVTKNKISGKRTFILNGTPVVTADALEIFWIDLLSKNRCIYTYQTTDKQQYLVISGRKYGPYDNIDYWQHACAFYWDGTPNLKLMYNKNSFRFERMGKYYRHDNDGSIYELTGESLWRAEEVNPQYRTKDGLHTARFSEDLRLLIIDGVNYVMPIDVDAENVGLRGLYLTDLGDCLVFFKYEIDGARKYPCIYVNNDSHTVEPIEDGEYFDPMSRSIKTKSSSLPSRRPRQMEFTMRWNEQDGVWVNGIDISLQDKTKKHFFTANWNYEYVMIDDKKIGNQTPISAFYDASANAFGWVTIEGGRQLVLYSYRL